MWWVLFNLSWKYEGVMFKWIINIEMMLWGYFQSLALIYHVCDVVMFSVICIVDFTNFLIEISKFLLNFSSNDKFTRYLSKICLNIYFSISFSKICFMYKYVKLEEICCIIKVLQYKFTIKYHGNGGRLLKFLLCVVGLISFYIMYVL